MRITILTLFPKMIEGFFNESIIKRAQEKGVMKIEFVNLRDFAKSSYGSIDDNPYGGGTGMVMKVDVLHSALEKVRGKDSKVILSSAKGKTFNQKKAKELSHIPHLIFLAGHYEGIDERILEYIDEEISIGDFVMTGGEIAIAAIVDSIVRLLPGSLKKQDATEIESFYEVTIEELEGVVGNHTSLKELKRNKVQKIKLLEFPQYTRPEEFMGKKVPAELLSGNHKEIEKWRMRKSFEETLRKRPDLLKA